MRVTKRCDLAKAVSVRLHVWTEIYNIPFPDLCIYLVEMKFHMNMKGIIMVNIWDKNCRITPTRGIYFLPQVNDFMKWLNPRRAERISLDSTEKTSAIRHSSRSSQHFQSKRNDLPSLLTVLMAPESHRSHGLLVSPVLV